MYKRQGYNARAVVTGDITQIDLPRRHMSGLAEAADLLKALELSLIHIYMDLLIPIEES